LPAASVIEKEGTFTNIERMIQWHNRAVPPPGGCRTEAWFAYDLGKRLKELYKDSPLERDTPLRHLTWDYDGGDLRIEDEPDTETVLPEINGYHPGDRRQLRGPAELASDGSTACGCWLYCGIFPEERKNRASSKGSQLQGTSVYGAWAWPENRRIINRRLSHQLGTHAGLRGDARSVCSDGARAYGSHSPSCSWAVAGA
jgi:formate dehydrogenase major subunit